MYLASRDKEGHGSFVVLHLLTSLWGLEQVCLVLKKKKKSNNNSQNHYLEQRRNAWSQFYATIIVVMAAAGGFPPPTTLEALKQSISPETKSDDFDWEPVVEAGIAEIDEHNIKLVYVTRELWKRYGHWKGFSEASKAFTLTPNIRGAFMDKDDEGKK